MNTPFQEPADPSNGGPGYSIHQQSLAIVTGKGPMSQRTLRRWRKKASNGIFGRQRRTGGVPRDDPRSGWAEQHVVTLFLLLLAFPTLYYYECSEYLLYTTGVLYSERQIGRIVRERFALVFKNVIPVSLKRVSRNIDLWYSSLPPYGVQGMSMYNLCDMDECPMRVTHANRRKGHCLVGKEAVVRRNYAERYSRLHGLIVAIHPAIGIVGWMMYTGGMTIVLFTHFLKTYIFPHIMGAGAAVQSSIPQDANPPLGLNTILLWDNLSSHGAATIYNLVMMAGIRCQGRPTHSPVCAPIEFIFHLIRDGLQHLNIPGGEGITDANIRECVRQVIGTITPATVANIFRFCNYQE